jgi:hypothetical protein
MPTGVSSIIRMEIPGLEVWGWEGSFVSARFEAPAAAQTVPQRSRAAQKTIDSALIGQTQWRVAHDHP